MQDLSYNEIEKMLKIQKTHRNIFDLERKYLQQISIVNTNITEDESDNDNA